MSCPRDGALSAPSDRPALAPAWDGECRRTEVLSAYNEPCCPAAPHGDHCDCWWEGEPCCRCGAAALLRWERFLDWLYCVRLRWLGW